MGFEPFTHILAGDLLAILQGAEVKRKRWKVWTPHRGECGRERGLGSCERPDEVHGRGTCDAIKVWRMALDEIDLAHATDVLVPEELERAAGFATPLLRHASCHAAWLSGDPRRRARHRARRVRHGLSSPGKADPARSRPASSSTSRIRAPRIARLERAQRNRSDIGDGAEVPRWTEIVREFFDETEREPLLRADRSVGTFLSYWTRKEAVAKATGLGLDLPCSSFTVSNFSGAEASIVTIRG